jgi:hypothetical protein
VSSPPERPATPPPASDGNAPAAEPLDRASAPRRPRGGGPNPWLVIGAAFAAGILAAKVIDWRGHAHPRR